MTTDTLALHKVTIVRKEVVERTFVAEILFDGSYEELVEELGMEELNEIIEGETNLYQCEVVELKELNETHYSDDEIEEN